MTAIAIVNECEPYDLSRPDLQLDPASIARVAIALSTQICAHVVPSQPGGWGISPMGVYAANGKTLESPSDWVLGLFSTADQPGTLGYHDKTSSGQPVLKVFPSLDPKTPWSVTASHEVIEALVDPECCLAAQGQDGAFWSLEVCDPVENDQYSIGSSDASEVFVSNFCLPGWFTGIGPKFDYLGLCRSALEVRQGGYAQRFSPGAGWLDVQSSSMRAYRKSVQGRRARRLARSVGH